MDTNTMLGQTHNGTPILHTLCTPDGRTLLLGGHDGTVKFWPLPMQSRKDEIRLGVEGYETGTTVSFSSDSTLLASCGWDTGIIGIWNTSDFTLHRRLQVEGAAERFLLFRPGTHELLLSFPDGLKSYNVDTLEETHLVEIDLEFNYGQFDADGDMLIASNLIGDVYLFNLQNNTRTAFPVSYDLGQYHVAISRDGENIAIGCATNADMTIWKLPEHEVLYSSEMESIGIFSLAFHPTENVLAIGLADGTIKLLDTEYFDVVQNLYGHTNVVRSVDFSPDGERLVSGGADHAVRVWDWVMGRELMNLPNIKYNAHDAAFSPDGRFLASTDSGSPVHVRAAAPWNE
jgi:WD40 repeat protein